MHIRTASGQAIAISEVADIRLGLGLAKISRIERKRSVTITADADSSRVQSSSVIDDIRNNFIPQLRNKVIADIINHRTTLHS